ncbi:MAG: thiamine-phosphate kinase, partial [Peptococcaceae bacterium]|nr:thiamine-phosphate kinase [Peptococcaceae bacterium]
MKEYDEFSLIKKIDIPLQRPEYVSLAIGDDCAVMPFNDEYVQVISCDLLTEGVHFLRDAISPQQLGYKSVAASLSDIAAMGGIPTNILISIALPQDYPLAEWQGFYDGVAEICAKYQVNLIGGDTTSSQSGLTINVTAMGMVKKENLHRRCDAKPGDLVFVTAPLGGSRAGLECVLHTSYLANAVERAGVLEQHFHPEPCCREVLMLNEIFQDDFHALNDISDGLLSECFEIAEASCVAIVLEEDKVPIYPGASLEYALTGGEDYQLVGTVAAENALLLAEEYEQKMGKPLHFVGTVCPGEGVHFLHEGNWIAAKSRGFNHFAVEKPEQQTLFHNVDEQQQYIITLVEENQQLLEIIEQQRCFRHDLNNHLSCIS